MTDFPLPAPRRAAVAVPALRAQGPGYWAGAPSADARRRHASCSPTACATATTATTRPSSPAPTTARASRRSSRSTSRTSARWTWSGPALVRTDGGWRLYVCCATPDSKHGGSARSRPPDLDGLADGRARACSPATSTPRSRTRSCAARDGGWHAWICCHLLDIPGEEDRMSSAYATSADGLSWDWHGTVLRARPGAWDARGARADRPCWPTAASPTTAARPRRRTGSRRPA